MKIRNFALSASALVLGLASLAAPSRIAAQPLWDRVDVNLPYSVQIGDRTLQPGPYVIQQLSSPSGGSQVLLIYGGENGMKFETSAMTIPALENRTQPDTRVMLHHIGNDYYFDKVWIQGKDYGYEFPLPNSVKMREKEAMQAVSVTANASTVTQQQATETAATNQTTVQQQTTTQPVTQQQATTEQQATVQQSTAPPVTEQQSAANRVEETPAPAPTPAMPHTSAGWLMMLVSGGALSGLGAKLRSKR
jgi:hypothetical protein